MLAGSPRTTRACCSKAPRLGSPLSATVPARRCSRRARTRCSSTDSARACGRIASRHRYPISTAASRVPDGRGKPANPCAASAAISPTVSIADTAVRIGVKRTAPQTIAASGSVVRPSANDPLAPMPQAISR